MKRILFCIGISALLASLHVVAWSAFDLERPGARAAGLGGAFCAVADDADAMFYNPSGLGLIETSIISFNYVQLMTGLDDGNLSDSRLGYVQPLGNVGTFGFTWYQRSLTNLYQENIFALGYGKALDEKENYVVGGTLKILHQDFQDSEAINQNPFFNAGTSKLGFGLDVGGIFYLIQNFKAGVSLLNLNQPNMASGTGDSIVPMKIRLGGAYTREAFLGTTEFMFFDNHYRFSLGGEAWWFDSVMATRLGLGVGDQDLSELTMGVSLRLEQSGWIGQIDYAFINSLGGLGGASGTHQVNFSVVFSAPIEAEEVLEAKALVKLGEEKRQAGKLEEALGAWEEASEVLDEDINLLVRINDLHEQIRRRDEAEFFIKQGRDFKINGNYISAAASYRKALEIMPSHQRATRLLKEVEKQLQYMSGRQKERQAGKEKKAAQRARQQSKSRAAGAIRQAKKALDEAKQNTKLNQAFAKDIRRLSKQLSEAQRLLTGNESDRALVLAQTVIKERGRFGSRLKRLERTQARRQKSKVKKIKAKPTVVKTKSTSSKVKIRKRARGAYGRAVKMMMDIEKLNGKKYYSNKVTVLKKDLAGIKVLLKGEDYTTAIEYAEKIYPKMKKLKTECEKKEKARRAMPTNW